MPEYGKKTVVELTEILKRRSLPHTGKKAELVARLNEADKTEGAKTTDTAPSAATPASESTAEKTVPLAGPHSTEQPVQDGDAPANTTNTSSLAPPPATQAEREGSATTDAKLATAVDYSMGLNQSSFDDELKKRKARAERFGAPVKEVDAEAEKAAERAKRFGTDSAADGGVGKLDEALPEERERRGKRGRDGESSLDDPGLKQGRGGKRRFQGRGGRNDRRGEKPVGVQKSVSKASSTFSSEKDRLAAEARKKKFATA
ncbi:hypothetical protein EPUS_06698 [Endocarpon pusillum Z07020]|uniref:SAP domain-containing protein n=1 Tax=Endocarpon pusillum (strain Z07020 / HMAS-L-300199) TaxID=1263415 RepID=U1GBE5_ENDPU|nr:uncharacterized protein EPUS_06698 [Endocarpon pusillum Z07020]ERF69011.1 hypothetical protein EPUS_06698 [Endocarpon pusillum Z07020]